MMHLRASQIVMIAIAGTVLWACGDAGTDLFDDPNAPAVERSGEDTATTDDTAADEGQDDTPPTVDPSQDNPTCVVALTLDTCCREMVPVLSNEVENNPCLVLYGSGVDADRWDDETPTECIARRARLYCVAEEYCPVQLEASRMAAEEDGECVFVDECQTKHECVHATDLRTCCGCTNYFPQALIDSDPCIVTEDAQVSVAGCRPEYCEIVDEEDGCANVNCSGSGAPFCHYTTTWARESDPAFDGPNMCTKVSILVTM